MKNPSASEARVKILIVDDHPAVREALAIRITTEANLEVCGEAADIAAAVQLALATEPDVAIVDIALKTGNGIDLIKRLKGHSHTIRMIVWSMYSEELYAERAIRAGAMGYLTKEQGSGQIIDAIHDVLAGNIHLSAAMAQKLLSRTVGKTPEDCARSPIDALSDRELDVFRLIGGGLKTQEIAAQLHLSVNTVETYRDRIRSKLDIASGPELARCAFLWKLQNG